MSETVFVVFERADVDTKDRQIIWGDGKRLSIPGSAQRIHVRVSGFSDGPYRSACNRWLEAGFAPPTYTPKQLDELDALTEAWVKDRERQAETGKKRPRTRHS